MLQDQGIVRLGKVKVFKVKTKKFSKVPLFFVVFKNE